jgi:hypothetical protein
VEAFREYIVTLSILFCRFRLTVNSLKTYEFKTYKQIKLSILFCRFVRAKRNVIVSVINKNFQFYFVDSYARFLYSNSSRTLVLLSILFCRFNKNGFIKINIVTMIFQFYFVDSGYGSGYL